MRILHVSEAFGGGVVTAILSFAANAPWAEHHLLVGGREGAEVHLPSGHSFQSIRELSRGTLQAIGNVREAYRDTMPDIVHLHSSFAGVYGRVAGLPGNKVVYTPHCFEFENTSRSQLYRLGVYLAEQVLSLCGGRFAGVSPRECDLARRMIGARDVMLLPNFAMPPEGTAVSRPIAGARRQLRGAMVGRLAPQKDPRFFLEVWREVRKQTDQVHLTWIGGGNVDLENEFRSAGVSVTGWIDQDRLYQLLQRLDFYVHTAAWEGNPMSILEAAALNLPIVARDIPALRSIGLPSLSASPQALATRIMGLFDDGMYAEAQNASVELSKNFSKAEQAAALRALYGDVNA